MVSRTFPAYHPKAGQQTDFVEKIWAALADEVSGFKIPDHCKDWDWYKYYNASPKLHTMRAGNRWKVGDMASLRYWSERPRHSNQVEFAQVEVKKVWPIEFRPVKTGYSTASINCYINSEKVEADVLQKLAESDGLTLDDLIDWFIPEGTKFIVGVPIFTGQIICWSDKVNY